MYFSMYTVHTYRRYEPATNHILYQIKNFSIKIRLAYLFTNRCATLLRRPIVRIRKRVNICDFLTMICGLRNVALVKLSISPESSYKRCIRKELYDFQTSSCDLFFAAASNHYSLYVFVCFPSPVLSLLPIQYDISNFICTLALSQQDIRIRGILHFS